MIPRLGRSSGEGIGYALQYSWASLMAQLVKNPLAIRIDLGSIPGLGRSSGEGIGYALQYFWASLVCLKCGGPGFDPWVGEIPWKRERLPTPVFWSESSMDCIVHGVKKNWT